MDKNNKWSQFFIGVVGTAIGVALTFGLNGVVARHKKAQDQRLTAIMAIHDIDCTIDLFKSWKQGVEKDDTRLHYVLDRRDRLDEIPADTIVRVIGTLVDESAEFHFDTSKEKIFNSGMDTWQNLGNMKFIDNVQNFFYDRQRFQDAINESEIWRSPVSREEYFQRYAEAGMMTLEQYGEWGRSYLKEKLYDKRVVYFIEVSYYRLQTINGMIDKWTRLNEENKFLMGITDRELEDYVNHIDVSGTALKNRTLKGTWVMSKENQQQKYSFASDHAFSVEGKSSETGRWVHFLGRYTTTLTFAGTWEMKGDSLILNVDPQSFHFDVDGSGLAPVDGQQDSLDSWLKAYPEQVEKINRELPEKDLRSAFKARLDSSRDKMEWVDSDGNVRYLKRESGR